MENRPILMTFQEYLNTVNFMNISRKDQIAYLMYYVTHIARLRRDMIALVLADRINDQILIENKEYNCRIDNTTAEEVEDILIANPDYFLPSGSNDKNHSDRRNGQRVAYVLSKEITDKLSLEFDTDLAGIKRQLKRKNRVEWLFAGILMCCLFTVMLSLRDNRNIANGLSWSEYVEYSRLKDIDCNHQCFYILYHITEVTHFKKCMTPEILSDRIESTGNGSPELADICNFLAHSDLVRWVKVDDNEGYQLTEKGKKVVEETVNENYKSKNIITLRWVFENLTVGLLAMFMTFISMVFGLGYKLGKSF